jgi:hypothetical protein
LKFNRAVYDVPILVENRLQRTEVEMTGFVVSLAKAGEKRRSQAEKAQFQARREFDRVNPVGLRGVYIAIERSRKVVVSLKGEE